MNGTVFRLLVSKLALTMFATATSAGGSPVLLQIDPSARVPEAFRTQADRPNRFPTTVSFMGKSYQRLTGTTLKSAIHGASVTPVIPCSCGMAFFRNGNFLQEGDQTWEDWGRYFVANDLVVTRMSDGGYFRRYAFYRSTEGSLLLGWEARAGNAFYEVTAKQLAVREGKQEEE